MTQESMIGTDKLPEIDYNQAIKLKSYYLNAKLLVIIDNVYSVSMKFYRQLAYGCRIQSV